MFVTLPERKPGRNPPIHRRSATVWSTPILAEQAQDSPRATRECIAMRRLHDVDGSLAVWLSAKLGSRTAHKYSNVTDRERL